MRLIGFIFCFLVSCSLHATHSRMNLQKALDKKLVEVKVQSLGAYQGFCMNMILKNLTKDSLLILVEAGRRFNSVNDKEQDILLVKEEIVALKNNEQKSLNLKGYCCQVSHHCPAKGSKYQVNSLADSNLVFLARYLSANEFDGNAEQAAVWALSDGRPIANITAPDDSLLAGLREKIALIKGEPLPWYRILSKKIIYSNGVIQIINLQLRGYLIYTNEVENYATLYVLNEKGLPVCEIKSEWLKITTGATYKLDLPIKGLAKGKYTVELRTPEKPLVRQVFEI